MPAQLVQRERDVGPWEQRPPQCIAVTAPRTLLDEAVGAVCARFGFDPVAHVQRFDGGRCAAKMHVNITLSVQKFISTNSYLVGIAIN